MYSSSLELDITSEAKYHIQIGLYQQLPKHHATRRRSVLPLQHLQRRSVLPLLLPERIVYRMRD